MSSQRQLPIIVASLCGLAAVIVVCVTVVILNRPSAEAADSQPTATEASVLDQKITAADSKAFIDRRERIRRITNSDLSLIKNAESLYENGTCKEWLESSDFIQDRAMLFAVAYDVTDDFRLCVQAVAMADIARAELPRKTGAELESPIKDSVKDFQHQGSEESFKIMQHKADDARFPLPDGMRGLLARAEGLYRAPR